MRAEHVGRKRIVRALFLSILNLLLVEAIAGQQPAPANSGTTSAAPGAITGRVVNESGQPLVGANVWLAAIGSPGNYRSTGTDDDGSFRAEGLDVGAYSISANLAGYVSQLATTDPDAPRTYSHTGDSVTLTLIKGGIIAGTITDSEGHPLVNAIVRALRVRDADGKPTRPGPTTQSPERLTDDRGYYRLYGLRPGIYVVSVGGPGQYVQYGFGFFGINRYENDAPTFAPSSTRDTAAEITIRSGQEVTADIRYRGEEGHSISGRVTGVNSPLFSGTSITLHDRKSHAPVSATMTPRDERTFALSGVPDGDYEIIARGSSGVGERSASPPRRVSVKGADITGVELVLAPLSSIVGRVIVEADPQLDCGRRRATALQETVVTAQRDITAEQNEARTAKDKSDLAEASEAIFAVSISESAPNDKGEVTLRNLNPGIYRIQTRLPAAGWFIRSMAIGPPDQRPAVQPVAKPGETNIARDGIRLKPGERVSGVTVTIAEGAASIAGLVTVSEGQHLPPNIRVHLVPAEHERIGDLLRFFETKVNSDGSFAFGNVAPGQYWVIARAIEDNDRTRGRPVAYDSSARTQLLRDAESLKTAITLQPCRRVQDYELRFMAAPQPKQ